jgi:hypothetical protein
VAGCDGFLVSEAQASDIGGFVGSYDLALTEGALVGDTIVVLMIADIVAGFSSFNQPEDDGLNVANAPSAQLLLVQEPTVPSVEGGGFSFYLLAYPVTAELAPGQEVHLTYTGLPAISFNYALVFRGVVPSLHSIGYHLDHGGNVWHDVGDDSSALFTTVDDAGIIVSSALINTPSVPYAGDPMVWADAGYIQLDAFDSDPGDTAAFGFDTMKGAVGYLQVGGAGAYEVGGSFSVPADSYRGGAAVFLSCTLATPPSQPSLGAQPGFLFLCGEEVVNNARTQDYLRAGLGSSGPAVYDIGEGCDCSILYRTGGTPVTFTSPAADPAPWYDPDEPDSAHFLGFLLDPADLQGVQDSPVTRAVYERAGGIQGATTGPQKLKGRSIPLKLTLVADDCCGLDYGIRWLTNTLAASNCDGCATCIAQVRLCCPPDDGSDDEQGLWLLYDVALIDGPHPDYSAGIEPDCCDMRQVTMTLLAGNAYKYKPAEACIAPTVLPGLDVGSACIPFDEWFCSGASDPICCTVDPPSIGTMGAIITISAPSGADAIEVGSFANCPPNDSDWDDETGTWRTKLTVNQIDAGASLIIDSARHQILYVAQDGTILDGTDRLLLPPDRAVRWIEVADCDAAHCICVRGSRLCGYATGDVAVTIEKQLRVI